MNKIELKSRYVYRIYSRNLRFGVFDGERGFIGIREKFGYKYLFTEYLADGGAFGTVRPEAEVGPIPDNIELKENVINEKEGTFRTYVPLFDYLTQLEERENE